MRDWVIVGSVITRSPEGSVLTMSVVTGICSTMRVEMLGLNPPVPRPMMIIPVIKVPIAAFVLVITVGTAETTRIMCPMMAMPMETQMAL